MAHAEEAREAPAFRLLEDGKPESGVKITVIPGGIRYRDQLGQTDLTTDAKGEVAVNWTQPGMYWMQASVTDARTSTPEAKERRANYVTTVEVMAQ